VARPRDHHLDAEVLAHEVVPGQLPAACVAALLAEPGQRALLWHGGGRCELALADAATSDGQTARALPRTALGACIVARRRARRGLGTPLDPLARTSRAASNTHLDPHGRFV
jgi:hypothetical protein